MSSTRALWVEAESAFRPLDSPESIKTLIECAKQFEINVLFAQVYRSGRAWFKCKSADQDICSSFRSRTGLSPLEMLIQLAHAEGIKVHAWLNVYNLGSAPVPQSLARFGPDSILCDDSGESLLGYCLRTGKKSAAPSFSLDTPGLWLDPGNDRVVEILREIIEELLENHQTLNGIHLDFFRYPYLIPLRPASYLSLGYDLGYTKSALQKFYLETGIDEPLGDEEKSLAWDNWRRSQINHFLEWCRQLSGKKTFLSVACLPWSDRAYMNAYQDWRTWLQNGLIDAAALMSYTSDSRLFELLLRQALAFKTSKSRVFAGIGLYKLKNRDALLQQLAIADSLPLDGVVYFAYSTLMIRKQEGADFKVRISQPDTLPPEALL